MYVLQLRYDAKWKGAKKRPHILHKQHYSSGLMTDAYHDIKHPPFSLSFSHETETEEAVRKEALCCRC
eukprot:scaffold655452_cov59-Prasinocladus_malaysianus.AAC.1